MKKKLNFKKKNLIDLEKKMRTLTGGYWNWVAIIVVVCAFAVVNDFGCFVDGLKGKVPSHKHNYFIK